MSAADRINRARWSREQRDKARAAYQAPRDEDRLADLRSLAEMMEPLPHMARTLAAVRAEIARIVGTH